MANFKRRRLDSALAALEFKHGPGVVRRAAVSVLVYRLARLA